MTTNLQDRLSSVVVCEPTVAGTLQVFGLRWAAAEQTLVYVTLDDALATSTLEVSEVSAGGIVPTLLVQNKSDQRVFLMAGEHLVGAKQDRVLDVSLMVPENVRLTVPVSCVEQGRWGYRSTRFRSSGSSSHARLRMLMSRHIARSYRTEGEPHSNQSEVWHEVHDKLQRMGTHSPSAALGQAFVDHEARLAQIEAEVRVPADCAGVVFAFGGRIAGLDLFDQPATLHKLLPKLIRAYAIDALEEERPDTVDRTTVENWVRSANTARYETYRSPGLGDDVRIASERHTGASLIVDSCPVHVELFPCGA